MGPMILIRGRATGVPDFGKDWRERCRAGSQAASRTIRHMGRTAVLALAPIVLILVSATARHWLVEALATICVVGGFVAAPLLTVAAWIGLVLPNDMPLHHFSSTLFAVALIWVSVAVLGAHVHSSIYTDKPE